MAEGKYFKNSELKCSCGCNKNGMEQEFVDKLDELRENFGGPVVLSSAYRCPDYNDTVSTTGRDGPHTTGKAVDVLVAGKDAHNLLREAMKMGFLGVGVNQKDQWNSRFIHLDDAMMGNRPTVWSYG